jgi:5'-3' exonuclease
MSKSTSLAQLQNNVGGMNEHMDGGGNMTDVDEVMNQLGNQEEYFEQQQQQLPPNAQQAQMMAAQQQQMMAAQQQQQQMMAAQQQQQQMMAAQEQQQMLAAQQQAQMMAAQPQFAQKGGNALLPTNTKQLSLVEKVMSELKDSLIVLVVFVLLNFKPVGKVTYDLLGKFTQNEHILLLARGLMAGVLFYVVKRLILNQ